MSAKSDPRDETGGCGVFLSTLTERRRVVARDRCRRRCRPRRRSMLRASYSSELRSSRGPAPTSRSRQVRADARAALERTAVDASTPRLGASPTTGRRGAGARCRAAGRRAPDRKSSATRPRPKKKFDPLHFEGNRTFKDDELSARVLTTAVFVHTALLGVFRREALLSRHRARSPTSKPSHAFYQNNGFYDTTRGHDREAGLGPPRRHHVSHQGGRAAPYRYADHHRARFGS